MIFQGQILNIIKGLSAVTLFYSNLSNLPPLFRGYYRWHTLALLFLTCLNLFLTWSGYNRCRSLSKVDSDKVITNDSKNTDTDHPSPLKHWKVLLNGHLASNNTMLKANFRVRPTTKLAGFVLTGDSLDRRSTVFPFALNKLLSVQTNITLTWFRSY